MLQDDKNIFGFPVQLQVKGMIFGVVIDKFGRCIYGLHELGIIRKCYNTQIQLERQYELVILDWNILGIEIDPRNGHLYYYSKNSITVLHSKLFTRMTQLYVAYFDKQTQKLMVLVMTTAGEKIGSFDFDEKIEEIGYYDKLYYIYMETKLMRGDLVNGFTLMDRNLQKPMKMIDFDTKDRFLTSYGIKSKYFRFLGNVKKANYESPIKSGKALLK
ncbi:hypothetical protein RF11_00402 [Thelohanellus kitauei]|uniref:Uncharacterized protein n=1 Tax=Thelohanellus kitauei TaxID=669202 RepID=A0A0C2J8V1_THEKT|nr:hypothetical protein RF11_00402 [Thelohanellus kitauei]